MKLFRKSAILGNLFLIFSILFIFNLFRENEALETTEIIEIKALDTSCTDKSKIMDVVHVTKEFDKATFGGLGKVVTDLSKMQANEWSDTRVTVILPFYSFLIHEYEIEIVKSVTISWIPPFWKRLLNKHKVFEVVVPVYQVKVGRVRLWLIGPGNVAPFSFAFESSHPHHLYDQGKLDNYLKDAFFSNSVINILENFRNEFLPKTIIHLHGSTNGLISCVSKKRTYKVIHTLHDDSFEFGFYLNWPHINQFAWGRHAFTSIDGNIYPSIEAIKNADMITTVSTSTRLSILGKNGIFRDALVSRPFISIMNGINVEKAIHSNLFMYKKEIRQKLITNTERNHFIDSVWILFVGRFSREKGCDMFGNLVNECSKRRLSGKNTCILFLIGQPQSNYPYEKIKRLARDHPLDLVIVDNSAQNYLYREAADISLVPSQMESFGLVALEGLMNGHWIVSTGVGGLSDFLIFHEKVKFEKNFVNECIDAIRYGKNIPVKCWIKPLQAPRNAFKVTGEKDIASVIGKVVDFINALTREEIELGMLSRILYARSFDWKRPQGSLDQYYSLYVE